MVQKPGKAQMQITTKTEQLLRLLCLPPLTSFDPQWSVSLCVLKQSRVQPKQQHHKAHPLQCQCGVSQTEMTGETAGFLCCVVSWTLLLSIVVSNTGKYSNTANHNICHKSKYASLLLTPAATGQQVLLSILLLLLISYYYKYLSAEGQMALGTQCKDEWSPSLSLCP